MVTAHGAYKTPQNTRGRCAQPCRAGARRRRQVAQPQQCVISVSSLLCASATLKGRHCFPLGVNNHIVNTQSIRTKTPHTQKKKKKHFSAHYRANQYFSSPASIVHAGHERVMRQSCKDNVLTKVGYLLNDKTMSQISWISHALPRMLLKWITGDRPLQRMSRHICLRAPLCFPLICCGKVLTPHMLFVVSALCVVLHVGKVLCKWMTPDELTLKCSQLWCLILEPFEFEYL